MRLLFELDAMNYDPKSEDVRVQPAARAIIIRAGTIALVHSLKYDYWKFPGGGLEEGEEPLQALVREVAEEAGLTVIPETIKDYGYVHRVQKGWREDVFVQDSYYYRCLVATQVRPQCLDDYEADEQFTLEFVDPQRAIRANRASSHGPKDPIMIERETRVLELLVAEGYFTSN